MTSSITLNSYPKFLKLLFFVEMWERFSYYGMRALLILFLTSHLGFSDKNAYSIYALFAAIAYAGPLLGGFLADRIFGFRKMIIMGGIIITAGHGLMALGIANYNLTFLGLALIAIGTGLFKGNITSLLGDCYNKDDPERSKGFTLFYVSVNLGSFIAAISCGYVAIIFGWHYGFGLAGIGMLIGLITFVRLQNILGNVGLEPNFGKVDKKTQKISLFYLAIAANFILSLIVALMLQNSEHFVNMLVYFGLIILAILIYMIVKADEIEKKNLIKLFVFVFFLMAFFGVEMQLGSLINLFTERNVQNSIFGVLVPASVSQSINPLSIIILGTLLSNLIKFNKKYENLRFACGLSTMAIAFFILYFGCLSPNQEGKIGYLYLLISMSFIGLGEVLIGPFVQEKATLLAPKRMKGFIMGIVLLSLAFSNLAGIIIANFMSISSIEGRVNCFESLKIYRDGFLNISMINLALVIIFLLISLFMSKAIDKK